MAPAQPSVRQRRRPDERTVRGWVGGAGGPRGPLCTEAVGGDSLSPPHSALPRARASHLSASLAAVPHPLVLEAGSCKWGVSAPSACPACHSVSVCLSTPSPTSPSCEQRRCDPSPGGQTEAPCEPREGGISPMFTERADPPQLPDRMNLPSHSLEGRTPLACPLSTGGGSPGVLKGGPQPVRHMALP